MVIPERVEFFPEDPTRPTGDGHFDSYAQPPAVWPEFLTGQPERPVRVLLVDDNEHVRRVIAQDLMADPRTLLVAQAASMKEGRKAIKQYDFDPVRGKPCRSGQGQERGRQSRPGGLDWF